MTKHCPTKLILFDIDGTLATGEHFHAEAFGHAFNQVYGLEVTIDWRAVQDMTDKQIITGRLGKKGYLKDTSNVGLES